MKYFLLFTIVLLLTLNVKSKKNKETKDKKRKKCGKLPKFVNKKDNVRKVDLGSKVVIVCRSSGKPKPELMIMKDGVRVSTDAPKGIYVKFRNKKGTIKLTFKKISATHLGKYECRAANKMGQAVKVTTLVDNCIPCKDSEKDLCLHGKCCWLKDVKEPSCRCVKYYSGNRCQNINVEPTTSNAKRKKISKVLNFLK